MKPIPTENLMEIGKAKNPESHVSEVEESDNHRNTIDDTYRKLAKLLSGLDFKKLQSFIESECWTEKNSSSENESRGQKSTAPRAETVALSGFNRLSNKNVDIGEKSLTTSGETLTSQAEPKNAEENAKMPIETLPPPGASFDLTSPSCSGFERENAEEITIPPDMTSIIQKSILSEAEIKLNIEEQLTDMDDLNSSTLWDPVEEDPEAHSQENNQLDASSLWNPVKQDNEIQSVENSLDHLNWDSFKQAQRPSRNYDHKFEDLKNRVDYIASLASQNGSSLDSCVSRLDSLGAQMGLLIKCLQKSGLKLEAEEDIAVSAVHAQSVSEDGENMVHLGHGVWVKRDSLKFVYTTFGAQEKNNKFVTAVRMLAHSIWGLEELAHGLLKPKMGDDRKPVSLNKRLALEDEFERLLKKKGVDEATVKTEVKKTSLYLSACMSELRRRACGPKKSRQVETEFVDIPNKKAKLSPSSED